MAAAAAGSYHSIEDPKLLLGAQSPHTTLPHAGPTGPSIAVAARTGAGAEDQDNKGRMRLMGPQDSRKARAQLAAYYRMMYQHVDAAVQPLLRSATTGAEGDQTAVIARIGVLSSIADPRVVDNASQLPWELTVIDDIGDEEQMSRLVAAPTLAELAAASSSPATGAAGGYSSNDVADDDDDAASAPAGSVVTVYTRTTARYTGMYLGAMVGVVGTVSKRDRDGRITSIFALHLVPPVRPSYNWSTLSASAAQPSHLAKSASDNLRIHCCSGPYPRQSGTVAPFSAILKTAVTRGADLLILCGPFVAFPQSKAHMPQLVQSFMDTNMTIAQQIDEDLAELQKEVARGRRRPLRVVMVPSLDDAEAIPVLPQPLIMSHTAATESGCLTATTNPCEVTIDGVRLAVSSFDAVAQMQQAMTERWGCLEGNLARSVDATVSSRLVTPMTARARCPNADLQYLDCLRLVDDSSSVKIEEGAMKSAAGSSDGGVAPPHIWVAPSSKPKFATVTHSATSTPDEKFSNEGDGVLVVNPGKYVARGPVPEPQTEMTIAEITLTNPELVRKGGASSANGVIVGTLKVKPREL